MYTIFPSEFQVIIVYFTIQLTFDFETQKSTETMELRNGDDALTPQTTSHGEVKK